MSVIIAELNHARPNKKEATMNDTPKYHELAGERVASLEAALQRSEVAVATRQEKDCAEIAGLLVDLELLNFMEPGAARHFRKTQYERIRTFLISLAPNAILPEHEQKHVVQSNIARSDYNATEQPCAGCGKPLLLENAWMEDGCPCNTPAGINNHNLYRWRLLHELQQKGSHRIASLEAALQRSEAVVAIAREQIEIDTRDFAEQRDRIAGLEKSCIRADAQVATARQEALEEAAKVCDEEYKVPSTLWDKNGCWRHATERCARLIRELALRATE